MVPGDKLTKVRKGIDRLLTVRRVITHEVQSVAGQINSMGWAFGSFSRMYMQSLNRVAVGRHAADCTTLELRFWQTAWAKFNSIRPLWLPTHVHSIIYSNAAGPNSKVSFRGWGSWTQHAAGFGQVAA
jgi:hypothetical protein